MGEEWGVGGWVDGGGSGFGEAGHGGTGRKGGRDGGHLALFRYAHLNLADRGSGRVFNDYMTLSDQERKVVPT